MVEKNITIIVSVATTKRFLLWNPLPNYKKLILILRGQDSVRSLSTFNFNGESFIISGSHDKTIKIWNPNLKKNNQVVSIMGHTDQVFCVTAFPNTKGGLVIAIGSQDMELKLWSS